MTAANEQQQPMEPFEGDPTITWGGNQQLTIPAGSSHDPVRSPLTTGQIIRVDVKHAKRSRTILVQLVVNCMGFDPADNVTVSGFLQTAVGVGQSQHTILSPFSITPTSPGVYPQFFDNGVIPVTSVSISATYNGGGILGSIASDRIIDVGCFATPWDVDGDHSAQEKLEQMATMMHQQFALLRSTHAQGVNLILERMDAQLETPPRLPTILNGRGRRDG